jgi:hypothetical protein
MPFVFMSLFTSDKRFFAADTTARLYHPFQYYMAKICVTLPFNIIISIVFHLVYYGMIGMRHGAAAMGQSCLISILMGVTAMQVGWAGGGGCGTSLDGMNPCTILGPKCLPCGLISGCNMLMDLTAMKMGWLGGWGVAHMPRPHAQPQDCFQVLVLPAMASVLREECKRIGSGISQHACRSSSSCSHAVEDAAPARH